MTPRERENVKKNCQLIIQDKVNQLNKALSIGFDCGVNLNIAITKNANEIVTVKFK